MSASATVAPSLAAWWEAQGALWEEGPNGRAVAVEFGSAEAEFGALRDGWAVGEVSFREGLDLLGEDRRRFLNGYLTADVATLEPGDGTYGFLTDGRGRILSDVGVGAFADRHRLLLAVGRCEPLIEHLERYVIADRVSFEPVARTGIVVAGPRAAAEAAARGLSLPSPGWGTVTEGDLRLQAIGEVGVPAAIVWGVPERLSELLGEFVRAGCRPAGRRAFERLRITEGVPRFGIDYGSENLPPETGLEGAVSYTKGCYLGQEVVARIHYLGSPAKALRRVRWTADEAPAPGAVVLLDDEAVGEVRSGVVSESGGLVEGFAMLSRKAIEKDLPLSLEDGTRVEIVGPVTEIHRLEG